MKNVYDIIRRPVITEQSMADVADKKYVFMVDIDSIKMDAPKTAEFAKFLKAVGCDTKALVVTAEADANVVKSGRNIPGCEVTFANVINVYDVVNANKLVVDKAALAKIEEVFA